MALRIVFIVIAIIVYEWMSDAVTRGRSLIAARRGGRHRPPSRRHSTPRVGEPVDRGVLDKRKGEDCCVWNRRYS